jgi:uncharacterized protein
MKKHLMSRRGFGALVAAAPALAQQQGAAPPLPANGIPDPNTSVTAGMRGGTIKVFPPFDGPIEFTRKDVAFRARPFAMTQVKLLPGSIFHDAQDWNQNYMSRLDADRLLYNFRVNAGLPTGTSQGFAGGGNGNWERPADGTRATELRGHFTGHFLSASAQLWAATGDKDAKAKGDLMVAELAKCQEKLGGGYLSAFPATFWERLDRLAGKPPAPRDPNAPRVAPDVTQTIPWAPFYTIHKIMAGLFDMYSIGGNQQALKVLEGMADWADTWTASKSEEHMQEILRTEFGGMAEVLYNLAAATNNDRWAKAGDRFTKKVFVNPLAMGRDELRGLHTNTHIPQVIAAARRYEISGDRRFYDVADFFYYTVSTGRTYVTGGTSNGEGWLTQPRFLAHELKLSGATAECCCSYNMLKVARHLYSWNADPRYFDFYERTMLNHRIGTIQEKTGHTQYYMSLTPGAWRTWGTEDQSFWCCTGSGVEEYSKLNDSIYWHDDAGLFVNLFIPSELNWSEKGVKVRQETKFPAEGATALVVTADKPVQMLMRLRIPGWLQQSPTVKVNGKALDATAAPGSYLAISRTWKTGDRVEMAMPMNLSIEKMPDDPTMQAVLYGPLVLAGDLGSEGLTERNVNGQEGPSTFRAQIQVPTFKAPSEDPAAWIKPGDQPGTFRTVGQQKDVTLVPLHNITDKRYSVYWHVS